MLCENDFIFMFEEHFAVVKIKVGLYFVIVHCYKLNSTPVE